VKTGGEGTGSVAGSIPCNDSTQLTPDYPVPWKTCVKEFLAGTQITLTAVPQAGSFFAGWNGCSSVNGAECKFTVDADKATNARNVLTAIFQKIQYNTQLPDIDVKSLTVPSGRPGEVVIGTVTFAKSETEVTNLWRVTYDMDWGNYLGSIPVSQGGRQDFGKSAYYTPLCHSLTSRGTGFGWGDGIFNDHLEQPITTRQLYMKLPVVPGTYTAVLLADGGCDIEELNETNNLAWCPEFPPSPHA
jgi:hypothetical protein